MNRMDYVRTAIRSVGASFPIASSVVNGWNEIQGRIEIDRLTAFIEEVARDLESMTDQITKDRDEVAKMFHYILDYAIRDPIQKKTGVYGGCLIDFCTTDQDMETVLNIVQEAETLSPSDVEVLGKLKAGARIDDALRISETTDPVEISKLQVSVKKLEAKALIGIGGKGNVTFSRLYANESAWPFTFFTQYFVVLHQGVLLLKIWDKYYDR